MRIRVLSRPPLPHIKAWFVVPEAGEGVASSLGHTQPAPEDVHALKCALRNEIPALRSSCLSASNLILMIDGFELLDQSGLAVIKDGDLVTVHIDHNTPSQLHTLANHRDPSSPPAPSHPNQTLPNNSRSTEAASLLTTQRKRKRDQTPSTESSLSSSVESDSSTSSDSTPSSSSSSSTSSSSPSIQTAKPPQTRSETRNAETSSPTARYKKEVFPAPSLINIVARAAVQPVPPGQGKPSTHSRNRRRRLLRTALRETAPSSLPAGTSSLHANEAHNELDHVLPTQPNNVTAQSLPSYSLKNKNKRRGFKVAMASLTPKRIDFRDADIASSASPYAHPRPQESLPEGPTIGMTLLDDASPVPEPQPLLTSNTTIKPRVIAELVPPSRRKDLPANIIVTAVNVESEMWGCADDMISTELSKKVPSDTILRSDSSIDWSILDSRWNELEPLDANTLAIGDIVAWQELGLDYITSSPKLSVILGRVTDLFASLNASSRIALKRLTPPNNENPETEEAATMIEAAADVGMELGFEEMKLWRLYKRGSGVAE